MNSIPINPPNHVSVGDTLIIVVPETRWWRRLWHFITFRDPPVVRHIFPPISMPEGKPLGFDGVVRNRMSEEECLRFFNNED